MTVSTLGLSTLAGALPLGAVAPESVIVQPLNLDLPVVFQLTRTRVQGPSASTITESFRETWTLEVRPGGILNLRSPRAMVAAFGVETNTPGQSPVTAEVPKVILVSERDFAKLVGATAGASEAREDEEGLSPSQPIRIPLGRVRGGTDVTLGWSDEEHYAVHIDVGTNAVY